jgi:type I restriction enzyme S subunit
MLRAENFNAKYPIKHLGEVVDFLDNLRKPIKASDRLVGEYPYYGANGLQGFINDFIFDEPLVLLAEDGGHFGNPEKTIAYIAEGKYWVNNHAHVLKPKDGLDLKFLCRVLENYDVTPFIKGATRAKLTKGDASTIPIPFPPLTEQKRIAAILDKADSLRRKNQQAIQLADQFLRAVFLDMFGDPVTNPKRWKEMTLSDAVKDGTIITYGIVQAGAEVENGVPYIRTGDFKNGCLVKSGYARTHSDIAAKFERSKVSTGDLVYCIRASIGSVDIVPKFLDGANLTQGTAKISPGNNIKAEFLVEFLRTKGFRDWIDRYSKGATFKEITLERLRAAPVLVPPLHIQEKFIAIRNKTLHAIQTKTNMTEIPLFESLSQKAFAGEL